MNSKNYKTLKRIYQNILNLTPIYEDFTNIIEKKNKKAVDFQQALYVGITLFNRSYKILKRLKKLVYKNEWTTLQQDEMHELYYLFISYRKVFNLLDKRDTKDHYIFKKIHSKIESNLVIRRNSVFVFIVNFISRNFLNLTLPSEFNVDKFINNSNKVSLLTMLNTTDWTKYFRDDEIRNEMISFSSKLFVTNWWNHSKYYRNVFVHRISLETYYSSNYKNMNLRIKTYLPMLFFLGLKYYLFNLLNDSIVINEDK